MKKNLSTILLTLVLLAGLALLLYPSVSDYVNSLHQSKAITGYAEQVAKMNTAEYVAIWSEATAYNESLGEQEQSYHLSDEQLEKYTQTLNIDGNGVMGYVEIPSINVSLPIYHGTDEVILQTSIGHLEWTSLPVGGTSSHCVLSGHRGLPSAKLFTNLDKLVVGDVFILRVLDEVLTYEVDQILIVEPQETDSLKIEEGKDYCTLVTCTPYGINTHRLLVRGHRIENQEGAGSVLVTADATQIRPILVAPMLAVPILILLIITLLIPKRKKQKEDES